MCVSNAGERLERCAVTGFQPRETVHDDFVAAVRCAEQKAARSVRRDRRQARIDRDAVFVGELTGARIQPAFHE
jgi:hypothetical protein